MKTKRTFASLCLALSCCALITASSVSVGDQPGVVSLTSGQQAFAPPVPVPPANGDAAAPVPVPDQGVPNASAQMQQGAPSVHGPMGQGYPTMEGYPMEAGGMPMASPEDYSPYFESSGVTEAPVMRRTPAENPLFGPQLMFETNIDNGLGFNEAFHRANVRLPYHVVPGNSVLIGDISASITNDGTELYNFGAIWRNYDAMRNRVFGWNAYFDVDDGRGNSRWKRIGVGFESLGKYIDFRANGYHVTGTDSYLLNDSLVGDLSLAGNNAFRIRNQTRDNAYSGIDIETGGPLPVLGRRGINGYVGGYYLDNDMGFETVGFSARVEALVTQSATVNVNYTNDDTFGVNSWVSIAYTIPNHRERGIFQAKSVRDRLADPVIRSNRVHSNIDVVDVPEAVINAKTGSAYNIVYVDPNQSAVGTGTLEDPYGTFELAATNNNAGIDIIRVAPRTDDTNTNLTANGGIELFDCQALISSSEAYELFVEDNMPFVIPASVTTAEFGPLISNPMIGPGGSVVQLANENTVLGMRISGANADLTAFGTGIVSKHPFTDASIIGNTFTNYETAVDLQNGSGRIVYDRNTVSGVASVSRNGLLLTTAAGPATELLVRSNNVNNSQFTDPSNTDQNVAIIDATTVGIGITANSGSTIIADDPNGLLTSGPTGIVDNVVQNSGDGIVVTASPGAVVNATVQRNQAFANARNGLIARADGGTFNLASMSQNQFGGEDLNGNGVLDPSEDVNGDGILDRGEDLNGDSILNPPEDVNLDGILDLGEDLNGNGILDPGEDTNGDGVLDRGEDLNGNGVLDAGEDTNGDGILDLGEDLDADGVLRPAEDLNGDGLLAAGNGENGAFLHFLNGGRFNAVTEDLNEDLNYNGIVDGGESVGPDGVFTTTDGILTAAEDANGNGILDLGIFANTFHSNTGAGLCIFGQDDSAGAFTIGGSTSLEGNFISQNRSAGIAIDLEDTATLEIDSMFNSISNNAGRETFVTPISAAFTISGNTFDATHTLTNTSPFDANVAQNITQFDWDLTRGSSVQGFEIDTERQFVAIRNPNTNAITGFTINNAGFQFTTLGFSELTTGLTLVNGFDFNNRVLFGNPGIPNPPPRFFSTLDQNLDQAQNLSLTFANNQFGRNESLAFQLDTDRDIASGISLFPDDQVTADLLAGTTGAVTFSGNFDNSGNVSLARIPGVFARDPNDPNGIVLAVSANIISAGFDPSPTAPGHGMRITASDSSRITRFNSLNDTIRLNKGDGLAVVASQNASVDALTIQGSLIDRNGGRGIDIQARDNAVITANSTIGGFDAFTAGQNIIRGQQFAERNVISGNGSDGVRILAANSGVVSGNLINNEISLNQGDGAALVIENGGTLNFGNLANNERIMRNVISNNVGSGLRLISEVESGNMGQIDAIVRNNSIINNTGGGILSAAFGTSQANAINLMVGGTPADQNTIEGNGVAGVGYSVAGNATGDFQISNSSVSNSIGDGIRLARADSAFLSATIDNVVASGNTQDGLDVDVQGNDKNDLSQPMTGTVNNVSWTNSNFSNNGENGARFRVRGDAQLIADGQDNVTSNNSLNGVSVQTSENATFGDATVGLPPGRRVIFDGTIANGNGQDGLNILATEDSRTMLQVTSNRRPGSTDAHAELNTTGDSTFSNNGRDGVHIETTGGQSDILITAGSGATTILNNGALSGGNGIRWDASSTSDATVRVTRTTIAGSIAGPAEVAANNGNGVLDPGEDINGNGVLDTGEDGSNDDIDVVDGDGVQFNVFGNATSTLVVGGIADGNAIRNNDDDGIAISATGSGTNISRPVISITGNMIGGENDGAQSGNGGDGISLNILGGTLASGNPSGPIPQMTLTDNLVSNNGARGVNLLLNGAAGERDRELGVVDFDPVRITLTGNRIASNGTEGIFYRADSEMNQGRFTTLGNTGFPNDDRTLGFGLYDPNLPQFLADNVGSVNGNTAFSTSAPDGALAYLNLRTVQNSFLTVVGNNIQNNGVGTVTGEGLVLSVGTGSYLAADVRNNLFGGNLEEDLRTDSFLSFGNTQTSINTNGVGTVDTVFHDDSAQLDMRFLGNEGNQISLSSDGAAYTNFDLLKSTVLGIGGVQDRDAAFFQVDDGGNLDNPNNSFINFGITQDVDGAFISGRFNLRAGADAVFPNIGFAPFLP